MIYNTPKEIMAEIKHQMNLHDISNKEFAIKIGKSQQSASQLFKTGNPTLSSLFEICNALDLNIDINFIYNKEDGTD